VQNEPSGQNKEYEVKKTCEDDLTQIPKIMVKPDRTDPLKDIDREPRLVMEREPDSGSLPYI